jgi:hypothetical protein
MVDEDSRSIESINPDPQVPVTVVIGKGNKSVDASYKLDGIKVGL